MTNETIGIEQMLLEPETYRNPLLRLRDRINLVLGETYFCARCGRALVVPQHLDHIEGAEGRVCLPCLGGS